MDEFRLENIDHKKKIFKKLLITIIGVAVLGTASFAGAAYSQSAKFIKEGDKLKSEGNYEAAKIKYNQALDKWKWNDERISPKINETNSILAEKASLDAGESAYQSQNWQVCVDNFSQIALSSDNYRISQERLQSCQQKISETPVAEVATSADAATQTTTATQSSTTNTATAGSSSTSSKKTTTTPSTTSTKTTSTSTSTQGTSSTSTTSSTPTTTTNTPAATASTPSATTKSYTSSEYHIKFNYPASLSVQETGGQISVTGDSVFIIVGCDEGAFGAPGTAFVSYAQYLTKTFLHSNANASAIAANTQSYQSTLGLSGAIYSGPYYWDSSNNKSIMFRYSSSVATNFPSYNAPLININTQYSTSQISSSLNENLMVIANSLQFIN